MSGSSKKKKSSIWMLIAAIICLGVIIACAVLIFTEKKEDVAINPFNYLDVAFEGDTGSGKAVFTIKEIGEDGEPLPFSLKDFTINQTENLKEGDTVSVKIDTQPEGYIYTAKVRNYTVTGLKTCIADSGELTDEVIYTLVDAADPIIEKNAGTADYADLTDYEPVEMILASKGDNENAVYCIYEASFKGKKGGTAGTVMAVRFDHVIAREPGDAEAVVYGKAAIFGEWLNVIGGAGNEIKFGYVPGYETISDAEAAAKEDAGDGAVISKVPLR
ncbi:MAG: hypothetical protein IJM62_03365 [Lachnospiraceae bacterium]|nr:hypothetical protein [Lachnospiraceae bacterium]